MDQGWTPISMFASAITTIVSIRYNTSRRYDRKYKEERHSTRHPLILEITGSFADRCWRSSTARDSEPRNVTSELGAHGDQPRHRFLLGKIKWHWTWHCIRVRYLDLSNLQFFAFRTGRLLLVHVKMLHDVATYYTGLSYYSNLLMERHTLGGVWIEFLGVRNPGGFGETSNDILVIRFQFSVDVAD